MPGWKNSRARASHPWNAAACHSGRRHTSRDRPVTTMPSGRRSGRNASAAWWSGVFRVEPSDGAFLHRQDQRRGADEAQPPGRGDRADRRRPPGALGCDARQRDGRARHRFDCAHRRSLGCETTRAHQRPTKPKPRQTGSSPPPMPASSSSGFTRVCHSPLGVGCHLSRDSRRSQRNCSATTTMSGARQLG